LGGGPIGLAVLQVLKARGARKIIVSEMADKRKQHAFHFGADHVLDPAQDDVGARCLEIFDGEGAHIVFDAVGCQSSLDTALVACRPRGTICNIAIWATNAVIQPNYFCLNERSFVGSATYSTGDFQGVIDAIASGIFNKALTSYVLR
jgi:threonine dehydrogenase-like Zn-dependent dehydrogenase